MQHTHQGNEMSIMSDIFSKNVRVVQVKKEDPRLKGFDSYLHLNRANFDKSTIYQDKDQSAEQKRIGVYHEKAHVACRKAYGRDYKPTFSKPVNKEIKKLGLYKEYSETYSKINMPEEVYCELYAQVKGDRRQALARTWRQEKFAKRYPKTHAFMKNMDKETGLRW